MYTQFTDKGYLDNNSTIYGPIRLDGQSAVTLSGNLVSKDGTASLTHSLEVTYDAETWSSSGTTLTQNTAPTYSTSTPLTGCTAVAVRVRSTSTGKVFYAVGLSISRN